MSLNCSNRSDEEDNPGTDDLVPVKDNNISV